MAYISNLTWGSGGSSYYPAWTSDSVTMTVPTMATTYVPITAAPKKRSAFDWLDSAVEEICALARDVAIPV